MLVIFKLFDASGKLSLCHLIIFLLSIVGFSQETESSYDFVENIPYRHDNSIQVVDSYIEERCVLDIYYPKDIIDFPTLVYFHGGALTSGGKGLNPYLMEKGIAVVNVNYRLSPRVKVVDILEDAATSVKWVFDNIENFGGSKSKVYLSGHSAGGYIVSMITLDKSYLASHDVDANNIAGAIPLSGHAITHFTARKEYGLSQTQIIVDQLAPLYHIRPDAPPYIIFTGDRDLELLGRYEENAFMERMMKLVGHKQTELFELQGYGHDMVYPALPIVIQFINKLENQRKEAGHDSIQTNKESNKLQSQSTLH